MRVFVYEYCCAVARRLPASLRREGQAMRDAVAADLGRCPNVAVVMLPNGLASEAEEESIVRRHARSADWSLVIAPESDGLLLRRCRWVEEEGGRLLGPDSSAVWLTGDKLELAQHWSKRSVPTPATALLRDGAPPFALPFVVKPRDGAGSQATFLVEREADRHAIVDRARADGFDGELIAQPLVPGRPASVAFLIGLRGRLALVPATQRLSTDGRFRYLGGELPLPPELAERARRLATRALDGIDGLRGYIGVDLILGHTASDDVAIEINPRLATSYVGLRVLSETNLAAVMLALAAGDDSPPVTWREGVVAFDTTGQLRNVTAGIRRCPAPSGA
jgi:predicted ATP-grasp superfamily ATP-dependent carboligase